MAVATPQPTQSDTSGDSLATQQYAIAQLLEAQDTTITGEVPDTLIVPALLFYSGKHTSAHGKTKTYSEAAIKSIVTATNQRLGQGQRTKLFSDHEYKSKNTLGFLLPDVEAVTITEDKLPHPGMTELVGKLGIFGRVQISGKENVVAYRDGRIKELSVGIDAIGTFGQKNAIYEVSAVPFPSLDGAALFAANNKIKVDDFVEFSNAKGSGKGRVVGIPPDDDPEGMYSVVAYMQDDMKKKWKKTADKQEFAVGDLTAIDPLDADEEDDDDEPPFLKGKQLKGKEPMPKMGGKGEKMPPKGAKKYGLEAALTAAEQAEQLAELDAILEHYGLTLPETMQGKKVFKLVEEVGEIWRGLTDTIFEINRASPDDLDGKKPQALIQQAIKDAVKMLGELEVDKFAATLPTASQSSNPVEAVANPVLEVSPPTHEAPMTTQSPPPNGGTEQFSKAELQAQLEQMQAQLQQFETYKQKMEREKAIAFQHSQLHRKADELVKLGKLTPAGFKHLFGTTDDDSIAVYAAHTEKEDVNPVEFVLDFLSQFGSKGGMLYGLPTAGAVLDTSFGDEEHDGGLSLANKFLEKGA